MPISKSAGLSPLARGTQHVKRITTSRKRFIPAGAGNTQVKNVTEITNSVYPRWRGEHLHGNAGTLDHSGLSPLARGTLDIPDLPHGWGRFIPAGAGNTSRLLLLGLAAAVYPRWRGEHGKANNLNAKGGGLSPLARGTRDKGRAVLTGDRFIPAGAGNTLNVAN